MVAKLRVNQGHVDLLLVHVALLSHLCEGSCQVNNRISSVMLGEQEDCKMLTLLLDAVAIGFSGLRRSVGWRIGAEVGSPKREGRFASWPKVGFERIPDTGVCLRKVVLKHTLPMLALSRAGDFIGQGLTRPFINTQEWNSCARGPGRNLTNVVHKPFKSRISLAPIIFLIFYYDTEMLRQLFKALDIVRDEFWCAVVVFKERDDFSANEAEGAPETKEDAEEEGDEVVDCKVEKVLDGAVFLGF